MKVLLFVSCVFLALFLFFPSLTQAATVFSTGAPIQNQDVIFPSSGSGNNAIPRYVFYYHIPVGVSFDKIALKTSAFSSTTGLISAALVIPHPDFPDGCSVVVCNNQHVGTSSFSTISQPNSGVMLLSLPTTFVSTSSVYWLQITLDPNSPYKKYFFQSNSFGWSLNGFLQNPIPLTPSLELCQSSCDFSFASIFDNSDYLSHNTRFLTAIATSTSNNVTVDVTYWLDLAEININVPILNPQYVRMQISSTTSGNVTSISELTDLSSSGQKIVGLSFGLPDGSYNSLITFSNNTEIFTGTGTPFPRAQLYFDFTISGGQITQQSIVAFDTTNLGFLENLEAPFVSCNIISDFMGCLAVIPRFLFVPSDAAVDRLMTLLASSSIPFVQEAYGYYQVATLALSATTTASSTMSYRFQIPEAGIDVEMLSAALITQGLGSAAPIFRGVAFVAVFFAFWLMIIRSIRQRLSVSQEVRTYS